MSADRKFLRQLSEDFGVSGQASPQAASVPIPDSTASIARMDEIAQGEYSNLVQRVFLRPGGDAPQVVVFAGVDPANGCTRVCRRTAEVLAQASPGTVCLVDASFSSPASPRTRGGVPAPAESPSRSEDSRTTYFHEMDTHNLWTFSYGWDGSRTGNPVAIETIQPRLQALRQEFTRVLIDAPPLNRCGDAMALAQLGDGIIVVLEANVTRRQAARKAIETLAQAGVTVLGVVLNKRTFPIPEHLYRQL